MFLSKDIHIKKKGCLGDLLLDDKSFVTKPHKHTQREVPAYHAPCCKSRTQRRDHHAYRKTPFTCIQSVTGWQNADLNSQAWCLLIPESQLSTFPALELPSKRSTFTAYSFLQKAVNELLHPTRTYEEISLICQNITTPVTKNGFHSEFLFGM